MITLNDNIKKIQLAFNKAAQTYDAHCTLQQDVGITLIEKLNGIISSTQINHLADLGCGTGLVTRKLINTLDYKTCDAIDIAELLLEKANAKLQSCSMRLIHLDFNDLHKLNKQYDLIFSNMALQWSNNLDDTLHMLSACLTQEGYFAFSLPLTNTFCELPAYAKNTLYELNEIKKILLTKHFDVIHSHEETVIQTFPDLISALHSIKNVGANCITMRSDQHRISKSYLKSTGSSQLTYHIGYFIAKKNNS